MHSMWPAPQNRKRREELRMSIDWNNLEVAKNEVCSQLTVFECPACGNLYDDWDATVNCCHEASGVDLETWKSRVIEKEGWQCHGCGCIYDFKSQAEHCSAADYKSLTDLYLE